MEGSNILQEPSTAAISIYDFKESDVEIPTILVFIPLFKRGDGITNNQSDNTKTEPMNIPDVRSLVKTEDDSGKQDGESTISPTAETPTTSVPNALKSHKDAKVNRRKQNIREGILIDAYEHATFGRRRLLSSAAKDKNKKKNENKKRKFSQTVEIKSNAEKRTSQYNRKKNKKIKSSQTVEIKSNAEKRTSQYDRKKNKKIKSSQTVQIESNAQKVTSKYASSTKEPKQEQKFFSGIDSYPQNTTEEKLPNTSMLCEINSSGTMADSAMITEEDKNIDLGCDKRNSGQIGSTKPDFQMEFNLQDENATSTAVESDVDSSCNFKRPYFCHECREVSNIDDHGDSTLDSDKCDGASCLMNKIDITDLIAINKEDILMYSCTPPEDDIDKIVVELIKLEDGNAQSEQDDIDKLMFELIVMMEGMNYPAPPHETMIEEILDLEEEVKHRLRLYQEKSSQNAD